MKRLSVTEYSALVVCSRQNVLKYLADNRALDGVKKSEKIGNTWVLSVSNEYYEKLSLQAGKGLQPIGKK